MLTRGPAKKLTVYLDKTDKIGGKPVYELLMDIFYRKKMAGASVLRGAAGYGGDGVFHTSKMLELSMGLPVKIEAVDSEEMITRASCQMLPRSLEKGL
jgi:PII-like signaling protein